MKNTTLMREKKREKISFYPSIFYRNILSECMAIDLNIWESVFLDYDNLLFYRSIFYRNILSECIEIDTYVRGRCFFLDYGNLLSIHSLPKHPLRMYWNRSTCERKVFLLNYGNSFSIHFLFKHFFLAYKFITIQIYLLLHHTYFFCMTFLILRTTFFSSFILHFAWYFIEVRNILNSPLNNFCTKI